MMREELAKLEGKRRRFQGAFDHFGTKSAYKGPPLTTILLQDIMDVKTQKTVTDHAWFTLGKRFAKMELKPGDVIRFDARVTPYLKGYLGRRGEDEYPVQQVDYRLSFPTHFVKVKRLFPLVLKQQNFPLMIIQCGEN